jgi:hypothetical protein
MELRSGVAYDAELAAEVARRLRPGVVEVDLAGDAGGFAAQPSRVYGSGSTATTSADHEQ